MSNKLTEIERIEEVKFFLNEPSLLALSKRLGMSNAQVFYDIRAGKCGISKDLILKIQAQIPNINQSWLLSGDGEMLSNSTHAAETKDRTDQNIIMVPVINLDARGGFLSNESTDTPQYAVSAMPFSREYAADGDIVIPIFGDSMAPKYPSGSHVLIRRVPLWQEYIELGLTYVLELADDRRVLKNIKRGTSADTFSLESINPDYQPSEIPKSIIRNIFRVVLLVRQDSI